MAKSNKPVNLDISGFMHQVQTNKPSAKKEKPEAASSSEENVSIEDTIEKTQTETIYQPTMKDIAVAEEETSSPVPEQGKRGKGRPPKKTIRNQRLIFKTDKETFVRLGRVKFEEKFDLQDIIHLAVIRFLDENFKKDGSVVSDEIRQKIKDDLSKYEIPAEGNRK